MWNHKGNVLAIFEFAPDRLPKMFILDDGYEKYYGVISYPRFFLESFGWVDLGEM